jgi:hypothetical protein
VSPEPLVLVDAVVVVAWLVVVVGVVVVGAVVVDGEVDVSFVDVVVDAAVVVVCAFAPKTCRKLVSAISPVASSQRDRNLH